MASLSAGLKTEKPSYSKIAATGLKPPSTQQNPNNANDTQKHEITSSPRDGAGIATPFNGSNAETAFTPKQKKLVPLAPKDLKETGNVGVGGPQVHIQNVDTVLPLGKTLRAIDGMLMPSTSDEAGTQVSSSSGSAKPPSLDGKSVTSGTTFALDEKESLRPDDSASVKATEEEDGFHSTGPGSGLPGSLNGSDDGVRAFHDQLREISSMEPSRQAVPPQNFRHVNPTQGVLYVPTQGSGVGTVPGSARDVPSTNERTEIFPDPKLMEALDSPKDRIMVLKLEQDIVDFVKDPKEVSLKLPQTNAFYRMLAHKLADYYMLGHTVDDSNMAVCIFKTPECRIPPPLTGIATPSTAASTPPPMGTQMKILRRGMGNAGPVIANGSNLPSKTTSENGDSGNEDERRFKVPASREEREARYEAARKRIMGSAKPSDSPEEPMEQDNSRSSSAAGKKNNRKKQRADSDDDFEARSAYSAYYPTPFSSGGPTPPSYGFPTIVDSRNAQFATTSYNTQDTPGSYSQYAVPGAESWPNQSFHAHESSANWTPNQQSGFDISADFQRSMFFQPTAMPTGVQASFNPAYGQQYNMSHQTWSQHNPYMTGFTSPPEQNYMSAYPNRGLPGSNQFQQLQPYQFGQLPSQAFPGRQSSTQEHPLPGSYKSKHFNPQSQSFVPGQVNSPNIGPFASQAPPSTIATYGSGYSSGMPGTPQRQGYAQSRNAPTGSPYQFASVGGPPRAPSQPMTHPLPQPVFPRHPSPNVPLPPRPEATPPNPSDRSYNAPVAAVITPTTRTQSTIAKWGTPASLPAKPPPAAEPFDPAKLAQSQRQAYAPANMPSFGSMPPMASGYGASAPDVHSPRRM